MGEQKEREDERNIESQKMRQNERNKLRGRGSPRTSALFSV
jgi:hypothetical protein